MNFNLSGFLCDRDILYFGDIVCFSIYVDWKEGLGYITKRVDYLPRNDKSKLAETSVFSWNTSKKFDDILDASQYYPEYLKTNRDWLTTSILNELTKMAPVDEDFINSLATLVHISSGEAETLRVLSACEDMLKDKPLPRKDIIGVEYAISNIREYFANQDNK